MSSFLPEGNLFAIGVKQDTDLYSPAISAVEVQYAYEGFNIARVEFKVWADEIGNRAVRCSKVDGSYMYKL